MLLPLKVTSLHSSAIARASSVSGISVRKLNHARADVNISAWSSLRYSSHILRMLKTASVERGAAPAMYRRNTYLVLSRFVAARSMAFGSLFFMAPDFLAIASSTGLLTTIGHNPIVEDGHVDIVRRNPTRRYLQGQLVAPHLPTVLDRFEMRRPRVGGRG